MDIGLPYRMKTTNITENPFGIGSFTYRKAIGVMDRNDNNVECLIFENKGQQILVRDIIRRLNASE